MEPVLFGNPSLFTEMSALPELNDLEADNSDSDDLSSPDKG